MEAVLLSTPQSFIIVKKEGGYRWAEKFTGHKENIDRSLSAILTLNTVAHTVGAAGVGAQAVKVFGEASFGIVSAILTILILVITEIIPKTIGARYWRSFAGFASYTIHIMIIITYPLVLMASRITVLFSNSKKEKTTSREEIAALAGIGTYEGVVDEKEHRIIQNILRLKNVKVKDIMTPRVVAAVADENLTLEEFLESKDYLRFSRIPVYTGNVENITGYVFRQTILEKLAEDRHTLKLKDIKRDILISPSSIALFSVWEKLLAKREHLSLVVDEYGGFDGIVTMEDIIETLLGLEIMDEKDTITDMQKYARERWEKRQAKYRYLEKNKKQAE